MLVLIQLLCGLNFYVCICFSWKEGLQETMSCWISLLPVPIARSSWCKHVLYCTFYVCTISSSVLTIDCFVSMCQALLCWPFFSIVLVLCASFDIGIVHLHIYIYIHVCVCVISIGAKNAHVKLFTVLLDLFCDHACSCFFIAYSNTSSAYQRRIPLHLLCTCFSNLCVYMYICVHTWKAYENSARLLQCIFACYICSHAPLPSASEAARLAEVQGSWIVEVFYWSTYHQGPSGRLPWN